MDTIVIPTSLVRSLDMPFSRQDPNDTLKISARFIAGLDNQQHYSQRALQITEESIQGSDDPTLIVTRECINHTPDAFELAEDRRREGLLHETEIEPNDTVMFADAWGSHLGPRFAAEGRLTVCHRPEDNAIIHYPCFGDRIESGDRLPSLAVDIVSSRHFAESSRLPRGLREGLEMRREDWFYGKVWEDTPRGRDQNNGLALVMVDGSSVLSLGIDLIGDGRGQVCFAVNGYLTPREILRRARALFPGLLQDVEDRFTLDTENFKLFDLGEA